MSSLLSQPSALSTAPTKALGRLTCLYKIPGAGTFRLSSAKFFGHGTNLQNPTESLMACVIPEDDHVFVQPDQAGAEALVVAMEARKGKFRRLFELNLKVHSYMALQLYTDMFRGTHPKERYTGVEPDALVAYPECADLFLRIKNAPTPYYIGKKTIHSFNYDEGIRTFILTVLEESYGAIKLSFSQGKNFKGIWASTFPELIEWQAETKGLLAATRTLRNLFGYPRTFQEIWTDSLERKGYAFVPQSTVGTITNLAYTELYYRIKQERLPWLLLNNKHDSLLLQVPDTTEHRDMGMAYCRQHMGRDLVSSRGEHYKMKVGISIGYNWGHHSKENPTGMKEL